MSSELLQPGDQHSSHRPSDIFSSDNFTLFSRKIPIMSSHDFKTSEERKEVKESEINESEVSESEVIESEVNESEKKTFCNKKRENAVYRLECIEF